MGSGVLELGRAEEAAVPGVAKAAVEEVFAKKEGFMAAEACAMAPAALMVGAGPTG